MLNFHAILFSIFVLFLSINNCLAQTPQTDPACRVVNGEISVRAGDPRRCRAAVQQYKMSIKEIGLCKGYVVNYPSSEPFLNLVEPDCFVIFTSDLIGGTPVLLTGNTANLDGEFFLPKDPGIYTHAYFLLDNTGGISGLWKFDKEVYDPKGSLGVYCWTVGSAQPISNSYKEVYFSRSPTSPYATTDSSAKYITQCGPTAGEPGMEMITFETLDSYSEMYFQPRYENIFSDGTKTIAGIYLLDSNRNVATSLTDAFKKASSILYFTTVNPSGSLTIDNATTSLTLGVNTSVGAEINVYNPSGSYNLDVGDPIRLAFISIAGFSLKFTKN